METPLITIFVRHSADCKYHGDEFSKRCQCRKHLRWTVNGRQHRRMAGTRSWTEAESVKRDIETQLAGKAPEKKIEDRTIREAAELFVRDKRVQGLSADLVKKYGLWLDRLVDFCERRKIFTLGGVTRATVTDFCGNWEKLYPSAITRQKLRERYSSFFNFCREAGWIEAVPVWPKIKADSAPTLPLTADEFQNLLDAVPHVVKEAEWQARVRGLFQLMRWSGLAIMDALTLRRDELIHDKRKHVYRIQTKREKTGTHVSVPIPPAIAEELLAVPNDNPAYFFWSGNGSKKSITGNWGKRFIVKSFERAGIESEGHMRAHRLRDTFAVDLLEKGVPLEEVSKLLGHESIKTTEKHYAAWVKGRQDRLDSLVIGTWN